MNLNGKCRVRQARPSDVNKLVEFSVAVALESERMELSPHVVARGVRKLMASPQYGFYVVAEADGEPVGCIMVTYEWSDWRCGLYWWIQSVYVKTGFRRRGVFRQLYEFVESRALKSNEVRALRLYFHRSNRTAWKTYKGVGMVETDYGVFETLLGP